MITKEIEDFKKEWGQTHEEICFNLGYDTEDSDDLLMDDYFFYSYTNQWYPKCSSFYTETEQEIADFLRFS
jgi:hypothetical protein